ncbi:MAG: GNAT family N-acetyltransferase [Planctomycetaceae bacterium]|nr:GNAT family N-acetyltransferase [Planctomycetaceae bacterium]
MKLAFRRCLSQDREPCVSVFRSNTPQYFREHELTDFEAFLVSGQSRFFVVERFDEVVGCGGYRVRCGSGQADLCWGMIGCSYQGNRIGEYLLFARLHEIVQKENVCGVRVATSQHTDRFYHRYRFLVRSRQRDGIDDGLDCVCMHLNLSKHTRHWIVECWKRLSSNSAVLHSVAARKESRDVAR